MNWLSAMCCASEVPRRTESKSAERRTRIQNTLGAAFENALLFCCKCARFYARYEPVLPFLVALCTAVERLKSACDGVCDCKLFKVQDT